MCRAGWSCVAVVYGVKREGGRVGDEVHASHSTFRGKTVRSGHAGRSFVAVLPDGKGESLVPRYTQGTACRWGRTYQIWREARSRVAVVRGGERGRGGVPGDIRLHVCSACSRYPQAWSRVLMRQKGEGKGEGRMLSHSYTHASHVAARSLHHEDEAHSRQLRYVVLHLALSPLYDGTCALRSAARACTSSIPHTLSLHVVLSSPGLRAPGSACRTEEFRWSPGDTDICERDTSSVIPHSLWAPVCAFRTGGFR